MLAICCISCIYHAWSSVESMWVFLEEGVLMLYVLPLGEKGHSSVLKANSGFTIQHFSLGISKIILFRWNGNLQATLSPRHLYVTHLKQQIATMRTTTTMTAIKMLSTQINGFLVWSQCLSKMYLPCHKMFIQSISTHWHFICFALQHLLVTT